ncbi:IS66 family transposase [Endomicrobium sp. AH-315-J14]|nr:IS66 family transposase [Endomicrobium sp. AH-315-J14]
MDGAHEHLEELQGVLAERDAKLTEREAEIAQLAAEVKRLTELVAALQERLGQDSNNSSKPPSSDTPASRNKRKQARGELKKKRKRGGQKGHKGHRRELLPESEVDEIVHVYPEECQNCWAPLPEVADLYAKRHQVTELPPVKPHTTEYRRHKVQCDCCGHKTRAKQDGVPTTAFGPRLTALMALLTGVYHLSRRKARDLLSDVVGVRVSLGALSAVEARVSDAVQPAVDEAWDHVGRAKVKHTDGTSWRQSGAMLSLWTIATTAATVYRILADQSKKTLRPLYGALRGILVSDRAKALNFWAMERRQVCWAHLIRRFISFSERDGPAAAFGRELLDYTGVVFEYWNAYKAGELSREQLITRMLPVRKQMEVTLTRAVSADIKRVSGSCADMLAHKEAFWNFIDRNGVDPTNNHAERELRAFVLWRKRSFGTQSERGNLFAERLMTVAHTARKQNKNVLAFLTACCQARLGTAPPSLFDADVR